VCTYARENETHCRTWFFLREIFHLVRALIVARGRSGRLRPPRAHFPPSKQGLTNHGVRLRCRIKRPTTTANITASVKCETYYVQYNIFILNTVRKKKKKNVKSGDEVSCDPQCNVCGIREVRTLL
jgi:hypothetical protein